MIKPKDKVFHLRYLQWGMGTAYQCEDDKVLVLWIHGREWSDQAMLVKPSEKEELEVFEAIFSSPSNQ